MTSDTISDAPIPGEGFRAGPGGPAGPLGIYYGWYNVLFAVLATMLVVGSTSYSFGLFVKPVSAELGLSRASTNIGLIMLHVGSALFSPFLGRILDRVSIILVIRVSAILFGGAFVTIGLSSSPLIIALCIAGPLAIGVIGCGAMFGVVLASHWFVRYRGRAIALAAMGTSFGGMFVFPTVAFLLGQFGWRAALIYYGFGATAVIWMISFFVREAPEQDSHAADRNPLRKKGGTGALSVADVLRNRDFWLIITPISMLLAIDGAMLATKTPYALDRGFSLAQVSILMTATTVSAISGKLMIAWIADRLDLRLLLALTALFGMILCGTLMLDPSFPIFFGVCCLTGMAIGGTYPLSSAIVARRFGAASVGTVLGLKAPIAATLSTIAIYFVGAMYDFDGHYRTAFLVFLILGGCAMMMVGFVRRIPPPFAANGTPAGMREAGQAA